MATAQQIAEVRANTNQLENVEPYTDTFIAGLIDAYGISDAERRVWVSKRNTAADLVSISEGGSSRQMQQVFEHYDAIVKSYGEDDGTTTSRAPRTREITRP